MEQSSIINLLICTDEKYAPYYGILLTSLFDTNKNEKFKIYVFTLGLSKETTEKFELLTSQYGATIDIIEIDEQRLKQCPIREGDHVTLSAYLRLLAPLFLPNELNKILYLDGDIIVNGSLKELWEFNINNYAIGAVIDEAFFDEDRHKLLNLDLNIPYINSGVLLINIKYWRQHNVVFRCMECIETQSERLLFHDQDTLNIVLQNEIVLLPITYNCQFGFIYKQLHDKLPEKIRESIYEIKDNPKIIHFSGQGKPWQKFSRHPYKSYFDYYKKNSLWCSIPYEDKTSIKEKISIFINKIVWSLGIKKEFNSYIIERKYKR